MKSLSVMLCAAICCMTYGAVSAQSISTFAGTGTLSGFSGDGGPATSAKLYSPQAIICDASGNLYIADSKNHCVRKVSAGIITTIGGIGGVGGYFGDGGPATSAKMYDPVAIAVDASGNVYVAEGLNNVVRKISPSGIISTVAGTGVAGFNGDGIAATSAKLNTPGGVWVDPAGNVYIGDIFNYRVRKVNTSGMISTYAGNGTPGSAGDGGPATAAQIHNTNQLAMDAAGNLYLSDNANHRIRKVTSAGIITTIAGNGVGGYVMDGVPATSTPIFFPVGVKEDGSGNVFFGEDGDYRVRKIDATGIITTYAGTGTGGYSGDGGPATAAQINSPTDVCFDAAGNTYIADRQNHCIRIIKKTENYNPYFIGGHLQTLNVCMDGSVPTNSQLAIADMDAGQTETWTITTLPAHGSLVAGYTAVSTGSTITPSGLSYTPNTSYVGSDMFRVAVSDGKSSDTTTVNVSVAPYPDAGIISGIDSVCPGNTVTLSETVSGGIWSTSSYTISYITSHGIAKGLIPGKDTIIYTVVYSCGIVSTIFPFTVRSYLDCHTMAEMIQPSKQGINIFPNPSNGLVTLDIAMPDDDLVRIRIMDLLGKQISEQIVPANKPVNMNLNVPAGVYVISATTPTRQMSGKLIIE